MSENEILFSTLAQSSPDCIKLFDTKGKLLFMNKSGLEEHGYKSLEEAQKGDFLDSMIPESQTCFKEAFAAALSGDDKVSIEIQHKPEKSTREFCLETVTPVYGKEGDLSGAMGVSRDISDRKRKEKELQEKFCELEKANNLMVGRELKMIELKKEIETLRQKIPSGQ